MLNENDWDGPSEDIRDRERIIPYVNLNGSMTLADSTVKQCWDKMINDGTAKVVFPDGINNAEEFLSFMKSPFILPQLIFYKNEVAGFTWLSEVCKNSAVGNFCFFKPFWGYGIPEELGQLVLDYWFAFPGKDGPLFDVIVGKTPEGNRKAIQYIQKIGFTILGAIPYLSRGRGMVISYKTR